VATARWRKPGNKDERWRAGDAKAQYIGAQLNERRRTHERTPFQPPRWLSILRRRDKQHAKQAS